MRLDLYVVTDQALSSGVGHLEVARRAVAGGADVIQLRDKELADSELFTLAVRIGAIVQGAGRLFIVNNRTDIALTSGADGVHLGQDDLSVAAVRSIAPDLIIGTSVSSVKEAVKAESEGADYVAVSPVFDTASKHDAGPGHGLEVLRAVRSAICIPVIGIGGIHKGNVAQVIAAGADGVAVISAVVSQPDITNAARELKAAIEGAKEARDR